MMMMMMMMMTTIYCHAHTNWNQRGIYDKTINHKQNVQHGLDSIFLLN